MSLPFVVVQGPTLIVDATGKIADIIAKDPTPAGTFIAEKDGHNRLGVDALLRGFDGSSWRAVNTETLEGTTRLLTSSAVTVDLISGFDNFADSWFALGTFPDCPSNIFENDQVKIDIAEGPCGATLQPAFSKTITVTAATAAAANVAVEFTKQIVDDLNLDVNFNALYKAKAIKDVDVIHIRSKIQGELGERPTPTDFAVTVPTGAFIVTLFDTKIIRRGKQSSGRRNPNDPRLVTVGISGEVQAIPGAAGDLLIKNALTEPGGSADMTVDGSSTPVSFFIRPDVDKDTFFSEIRFRGQGNGIQLTNYLSKNMPLTNGVLIKIRSDNTILTLPLIKTTSDFKFKFAFGEGRGFQLFDGAGTDDMLAAFTFSFTFPLRKTGTFGAGNDDFIEVVIQDALQAGIVSQEMLGFGFKREI